VNPLLGSAVFLTAFFSFISRVCPTVYADDSPETVTAMLTLGITHPPGDPVLALAGKAWCLLPLGNMALRMNLLSAFLASLACLLAVRLAVRIFPGRLPAVAASLSALALFVFNPVMVQQAAVAKGAVYTMNMALVLAAATALRNRNNIAAALVFGLLASHHWMTFAAVSPVLGGWWAVNLVRYKAGRPRRAMISILVFVLGMSVQLFLPLRASQDIFLAWGRPSTMQRWSAHYLRKVYLPEEMRATPLTWRRQAAEGARTIYRQVGWPGLALAAAGVPALLSSAPPALAISGAGILVPWIITAVYLDLRPELMHLLGIYLLSSWLALVFLAVAGASWLGGPGRKAVRLLPLLLTAGAAAILYPAGRIYNVSHSTWSYDTARAMLAPLPPNAGLLVTSDLDTFPLWYFQAVEGYRADVLVVNTTMMRHQWYREQIQGLSGVRRLGDLDDRDAAVRYMVFSSRRFWFSAAGDIVGVPPDLPRVPYHLTYQLGGGKPVVSFRGLPARGIFDCWSRLPEPTAARSLDYLTEVIRNTSRPR